MKITLNGEEVLTLSDIQKAVIKNDVMEDIFESDMRRRLKYIIEYTCESCVRHHESHWKDKLCEKGVKHIPVSKKELAEMVFSQGHDFPLEEHEYGELVVAVDGKELFRISDTEKKLLKIQRSDVNPNEYIKHMLSWALLERYRVSMQSMRHDWEQKLAAQGVKSIPASDDDFAAMVVSHRHYKNRSTRENELEAERVKKREKMAKERKSIQPAQMLAEGMGQTVPEVSAEKPTFLKRLFSRGE